MKALPLHPPYGTLIALRLKVFETRHWPAPQHMIGRRIAIYQTKTMDRGDREVARGASTMMWGQAGCVVPETAKGAIVCTAVLTGCWEMTAPFIREHAPPGSLEQMFGCWQTGRFAWELHDVDALEKPEPMTWPVKGPAKYVSVPADLASRLTQRQWNARGQLAADRAQKGA